MAEAPIDNGEQTDGDVKSEGRNRDGTFSAGNTLGGRTPGARNKTTLAVETLLEGQYEELTQAAITKALEGHPMALRLCLERIAPARRDSPITFEMPDVRSAADAVEASASLLSEVAAGHVTPDEAGRVMALLTAHKQLVETCDLETRLAALEAKENA